ncbi:helix-turn-helix domain-containing protein [Cryptosporangium minutisporangium]|uniref:HTH cro/C1-type domain-containing protein n=1 Tax=Cryptosporangium minutisporangium TaxID=113569 RepID=A0ABP6SXE1_9ACTN
MTENQGSGVMVRRVGTPEDLGAAIADIRKQRGMTQQELGEWTGLHRQYVGLLETGQVSAQVRRLLDLVGLLGYEIVLVPRGAPVEPSTDDDA